jgi:hypothetical protein
MIFHNNEIRNENKRLELSKKMKESEQRKNAILQEKQNRCKVSNDHRIFNSSCSSLQEFVVRRVVFYDN